ncbi:MAG: uroporphyrinogen decarboxylase family protein [Promethearchaeota archaeon]
MINMMNTKIRRKKTDKKLQQIEIKRELEIAIKDYKEMLYGKEFSNLDSALNFNVAKNPELTLSFSERTNLILHLIPKLFALFSPKLLFQIKPFYKELGSKNLDEYISLNLFILNFQAKMQNFPIKKIHALPNIPKISWNKRKINPYLLKKYHSFRKKLEKIIDLERNSMMSSFERFHSGLYNKMPDRIPFTPLMDNFYAAIADISVKNFVSYSYKTIFKIVDFTHNLFYNYFDMAHLPPGRMYSFFQPVPAAHSAFYSKLILPSKKKQLLQFLEKNYINIKDFNKIMKYGFSIVWRKRPLRLIYETMLDFLGIGSFFYTYEKQKQIPLYTGSAFITPLEALSYLMGINKWSRAIIKHQEETQQFCEFLMRGLKANDLLLKKFSGVKRDYICLERVSPQFISPKIFEKMVFPHIKQIAEQNLKLDYINLYHMDTDWEKFLPYFAEQLPKSGKYIFHLENTNIYHAKKILEPLPHSLIMGNLEAQLLAFGTPQQLERKVANLIKDIGYDGKYLISPGCHLPPDTPLENIFSIIKTIEQKGWYKT